MTGTTFTRNNLSTTLSNQESSITTLERDVKTFQPLAQPSTIQELTFLFQATQFVGIPDDGDTRIYANTAPSAIDEETLASVAAYARFDDVGGNANGSTSTFDATMVRVPLEDNEGRTAYYHGYHKYLRWDPYKHPEVSHTKQFMLSHSIELNVPGTETTDQEGFVYYEPHADMNITNNASMAIWFYPTDISQIGSETWRTLLYRRAAGASTDSFAVLIKPADSKLYAFVNETSVISKKVSTSTVNVNAWNLIILTYDVTANTLTIYLNNSSASSTPADSYTPPYTTDSNAYIGGLPNLPDKRFTGYLDNFVFWKNKILTGTEASNMWNHGTII